MSRELRQKLGSGLPTLTMHRSVHFISTSLLHCKLFGDPAFRSTTLQLTLPADCFNADEDMMHLLTQRVTTILCM